MTLHVSSPLTSPAVTVTNLRRAYGGRVVIEKLNLHIERGEFVALLGESGCGKTTLLRALAGLDPIQAGRIVAPRRPAVVFQEHRLLPWDNLCEPFAALDALTRIRMHALVRELVANHRPGVLLVTHDVDEAIALADRILVMRDGAIAFEHTTKGNGSGSIARVDLLAELGVLSSRVPA